MANLKPVNWKEVAKRGCFVYAYLRQHDHTPYYIGKGSRHDRAFAKHTCELPAFDDLAVCLRSGLTKEEAEKWEKFYIARYGRNDMGAGILRNQTDGGEGSWGVIQSNETRAKRSQSLTGRTQTQAEREAHSVSMRGRTLSEEHKHKVGLASRGRKHTPEARAKMSAKARAYNKTEEHKANQALSRKANTAQRYGIPLGVYLALGVEQIRKLRVRFNRGKRGAALTAGII